MVFLSLESLEKEWFMKRNIFRNKFLFLDFRSENYLVGKAHLVGFFAPPFPNQRSLGVGFPVAFPSAQEAQFIGLHSVGTPVGFGAKKVHY